MDFKLKVSDMAIKTQLGFPIAGNKETPANLKEFDETPATIYIKSKAGLIKHMSNFFYITNIQEIRQERSQIVETFGASSYFFFGERTKIYSFSGYLLEAETQDNSNTYRYRWTSSLIDLYDNYMRGSKLAENGEEVVLRFNKNTLYGYIIGLNVNRDAKNAMTTTFSFNMIVRDHQIMGDNIKNLYSLEINDPAYKTALKQYSETAEKDLKLLSTLEPAMISDIIFKAEENPQITLNLTTTLSSAVGNFIEELKSNLEVNSQIQAAQHTLRLNQIPFIEGLIKGDNLDTYFTTSEFNGIYNYVKTKHGNYLDTLVNYYANISTYNFMIQTLNIKNKGNNGIYV